MEIQHNQDKRQFEMHNEQGELIGEIKYMVDGDGKLLATETEVSPDYGGKGYARDLLEALVAYAREQQTTIVPICPYVIYTFKKYPDRYQDVI